MSLSRAVVVTGAGGRIGAGIAARLQEAGRLHAGLDIKAGPMVSHVVDLADMATAPAILADVFKGADAAIHVAAHPGPAASEPASVRKGWGHATMAAGWCHDPTTMVPKALPISHPSDAQPHETYGLSKVCCEEIASMLARCSRNATGFVSLRFTNIVKRELFPAALPFPAPPLPPTMPSEVTPETQALPV
eukprot:gene21341-33860_t